MKPCYMLCNKSKFTPSEEPLSNVEQRVIAHPKYAYKSAGFVSSFLWRVWQLVNMSVKAVLFGVLRLSDGYCYVFC